MEKKLDAPLRQRIAELEAAKQIDDLDVFGKCSTMIDAEMRQDLMEAGARVQTMNKEIFTAVVSSDSVLKVAALDFVVQLQLSQESNPLQK